MSNMGPKSSLAQPHCERGNQSPHDSLHRHIWRARLIYFTDSPGFCSPFTLNNSKETKRWKGSHVATKFGETHPTTWKQMFKSETQSSQKTQPGTRWRSFLEQRMNLDIGIDGLRGITDESRSYQTETHHRLVIASQKRMRRFQLECIGIIWLLWIRSGKLAKHGIDGGGRVSWIRDSEYALRVILEQTLMRRMI